MSEGIGVYKAIAAVQAELAKEGISKNRRNDQQGYKFRGIDDVYDALAPVLSKNGLCFLPRVLHREITERTTARGGVIFYVVVECEFDLVSSDDGSKHVIRTFGEAMDSADKATNKAMSSAYKYAAFQAFCIPCEGEDADSITHEVQPRTQCQRPQRYSKPAPPPLVPSDKYKEYMERIKTALKAIFGDDKAAALDEVERLTAFKGKDGNEVAGKRDFTKLSEKAASILCHHLEKRLADMQGSEEPFS